MLNHISQVFEIPNVAHEVQRIIDGTEINKNILTGNTAKYDYMPTSFNEKVNSAVLTIRFDNVALGRW